MKNVVNVEKMFLEGASKSEVLKLVDNMYDSVSEEYKAKQAAKRAFREVQTRVSNSTYTLEDLEVLKAHLDEKSQKRSVAAPKEDEEAHKLATNFQKEMETLLRILDI